MEHLNEVRKAKNDKQVQLKDLRVTISDRVRKEIELDMLIARDGAHNRLADISGKELLFAKAPSSKSMRAKYSRKEEMTGYEKKIINISSEESKVALTAEEKERLKKGMVEANKNPRLVTPATQYDIKHMDSQQNVGGFEKKYELHPSKKQSVAEVHKEFETLFGLTVMAIEVFVQNRPGCVTNFEHDMISAVFFVVHSECAEL